jgi:hypothetical protein
MDDIEFVNEFRRRPASVQELCMAFMNVHERCEQPATEKRCEPNDSTSKFYCRKQEAIIKQFAPDFERARIELIKAGFRERSVNTLRTKHIDMRNKGKA